MNNHQSQRVQGTHASRQLFFIACLLGSASVFAQAPRYGITDIGALAGHSHSRATALNELGDVTGESRADLNTMDYTGFVWSLGQLRSVGRLPGGNYSSASALSANGLVAGDGDTGDFRPQGLLFKNGVTSSYATVNGGNVRSTGILDSGRIYGNFIGSGRSWRAASWQVDPRDPRKFQVTEFPVSYGRDKKYTYSWVNDVNLSGTAVGYNSNEVSGQRAALWSGGRLTLLASVPGVTYAQAYGVNNLGVAVGASGSAWEYNAVLWRNDATRSLQVLGRLPGDTQAWAEDVNDAGVVVGMSRTASGVHPFVYEASMGMQPISALLDPAFADWTIVEVVDINSAGQIAATAQHDGLTRAVLLTPLP